MGLHACLFWGILILALGALAGALAGVLGTDLEDTGNSAARPAGLLATRQAPRRAALAHLEGLWALLAPIGWLASSLLLRALSPCAGLGRRLGHRLGRR